MAWFVSRRNCPSFLTANTVAGPLDNSHRSGRAGGDHQDPPTTLLLPRRTAHPLGATPHFASSKALALGKPVQSRPRSIASPATPSLTAPVSHLPAIWPTERPRQLAPTRSARGTSCLPPVESPPPWPHGRQHRAGVAALTPPSSPSIGIGPTPFAFPYSSSMVSTPATIASVDSGLAGNPQTGC